MTPPPIDADWLDLRQACDVLANERSNPRERSFRACARCNGSAVRHGASWVSQRPMPARKELTTIGVAELTV